MEGISLTAQFNTEAGVVTVSCRRCDFFGKSGGTSANNYNDLEYANMPSFWNTDNMFVYNDVVDAAGNVVVKANRNGKKISELAMEQCECPEIFLLENKRNTYQIESFDIGISYTVKIYKDVGNRKLPFQRNRTESVEFL